jgi:hypothetical protein
LILRVIAFRASVMTVQERKARATCDPAVRTPLAPGKKRRHAASLDRTKSFSPPDQGRLS